jgi:hypothetical protein
MNCDKKQFTKLEAQTVLNRMTSTGQWNKKDGKGRYYHCQYCNHWHITSLFIPSDEYVSKRSSDFTNAELKHTDKWNDLINKE